MIGAAEDAGYLATAQARRRVGHHQHRHPAATAAAWDALPGCLPGIAAYYGFAVEAGMGGRSCSLHHVRNGGPKEEGRLDCSAKFSGRMVLQNDICGSLHPVYRYICIS